MRRSRRTWLFFPLAMLRGRFALCVLPLILFTALILGALRLGATWIVPPTYLQSGDCDQPCWRGLRPGDTTQDEAQQLIEEAGLAVRGTLQTIPGGTVEIAYLSWETNNVMSYDARARFRSDLLTRLELYPDGPVLLSEIFAVFGPPSHALMCQEVAGSLNYREAVFATLYFYGGAVEVIAFTPNSDIWRVRPDMRVMQIVYRIPSDDSESWIPLSVTRWHGFGSAAYGSRCR